VIVGPTGQYSAQIAQSYGWSIGYDHQESAPNPTAGQQITVFQACPPGMTLISGGASVAGRYAVMENDMPNTQWSPAQSTNVPVWYVTVKADQDVTDGSDLAAGAYAVCAS
jgi:hypothetical protein